MTTYAKVLISATLTVETGLHIGGGGGFSAIGAIDLPVVKDALTNRPMIPGSSLKGKMRSLLAREYNTAVAKTPDKADTDQIKRLFGSSDPVQVARLTVRDSVMTEAEEKSLRKRGAATITEVKYENTIDRITAVANPRQIERVIRGSHFPVELVYEVADTVDGQNRSPRSDAEIQDDFKLIADGLTLLTYDYLGGHGTRGSGRVSFSDIKVTTPVGELVIKDDLEKVLQDAVAAV